MMLFHIKAYDWNCPQHITPKYTLAEIEQLFEGPKAHIKALEREIETLKEELKKYSGL